MTDTQLVLCQDVISISLLYGLLEFKFLVTSRAITWEMLGEMVDQFGGTYDPHPLLKSAPWSIIWSELVPDRALAF